MTTSSAERAVVANRAIVLASNAVLKGVMVLS
jgi:hypothetical protein